MARIAPLLSYYYDVHATNELPKDEAGNYVIDFGEEARRSPPVAGVDTVVTVAYVRNDHPDGAPMELRPSTLDPDLTITEWPEYLEAGQIGKVKFAFSPSADRIKPLSGGAWDFSKIIYGQGQGKS